MTIPKEFECPICLNLLFKPVTTSCGHNFCKQCIDKTLLVTQNCPICKLQLTNDYSPNLLLVQIINERFPEEINSRYTFTIPPDTTSDADSTAVENKVFVPMYFLNFYEPPLFEGNRNIVIDKLKEYRMLQYALANGSNIILAKKYLNKTVPVGTLVKITSNMIGTINDSNPRLPLTVEVSVLDRVKLKLPATLTDFNFYHCDYVPFTDKWIFTKTRETELNVTGSERTIYDELSTLEDNINKFCKNYDTIVEALRKLKNMNNDLTGYNRYFASTILINTCIILLKRQLHSGQKSLRARFESIYGSLPILADSSPQTKKLESLSLYLSKVVLASTKTKWEWYSLEDTFERLIRIAELIAQSRDRNVLNLKSTMLSELANSVDPVISSVVFILVLFIAPRLYRKLAYR
ncbi:uncharacterized protein TOT_040000402 [Theileria orientalis strain Shintoku]|uniref:RING-type domain-containing protein n=1 Tax=Theileria orientalis strain Shintoku TaxID=869250 RepID=J4C4E1_THEOR|nr:uncharacterized protein TOT_040000402 [Theileria orientalis strain Shintoku]BAM42026.1 uncharacterized protein TOT_040000402 [Theileria orientalis strain Shintoku]|eukprot:XP_009692327.1 uncharacterized protein TOT_040000402 [Theileria orientalis strain Shintoku]